MKGTYKIKVNAPGVDTYVVDRIVEALAKNELAEALELRADNDVGLRLERTDTVTNA
jgi:hypothetical protein